MDYKFLGKTNIKVSKICFGTLTIGPLQANLNVDDGANILAHGINKGINFFDTAELYETYPYIKKAMEITNKFDIVVSSKTYAHTRKQAEKAVNDALKQLDRDYIDIFMLHEQESIYTLKGHLEALEYLFECKQKGIIRAVGASMHHIAAVKGAIEFDLDIIHPLINVSGLGIVDGSRDQMEEVLKASHKKGIGIFSMKALGGGNLFKNAEKCLEYITKLNYIDSIAIGMQDINEINANVSFFINGKFTENEKNNLVNKVRKLHIDDWCIGCGDCVKRCAQKALYINNEKKAVCLNNKCVLCGYCSTVCKEWAIKIV